MKKIFILILVLGSLNVFAQTAANYIFSTNSSTALDPLVSPTTLFGINVDDQASALTNIGFNFSFAGTTYTQFSASSNGVVCLGATAFTTFTNTFPINASVYPVLMPFWDDLYTAGNGVRYEVKGTAPNRKLVVEWEVTNCCVGGVPDKKFQLWLFETSNYIQFVYDNGANINNATIGIASSSAFFHSVTSSTHTSSTSIVDNNNTVWPGAQRSYLFYIAAYDPALTVITTPAGNCFTANQVLTMQLCNLGSSPIDLSVNPATFNLTINGPNGPINLTQTINLGLLNPLGASCVSAIFPGINMYAGGTYIINGTISVAGVTNANLLNDSLSTPITKINFRPTAGAPYQLCQYSAIPFGQGLTVSGCATPLSDSVTINFTVLGPCNDGNNDAASCQFATAVLPSLPAGATFQNGILEATNLSTNPGSWRSEVRMNLYGTTPVGTNLFSPGITMPGSLSSGSPSFTHARNINSTQLGNMYAVAGVGNPVNVGYWESFNDVAGSSDININALSVPTTVTLKIYYQYVPASFEWYSTPTGGLNLYSFSPFNPLITTGSGLSNSNTPNTYTWFAACSGSSNCRVPVNLVINPTPQAFQDTLSQCEFAVSSNSAIFDLTTMNNAVSGNNPLVSVDYFFDEPLLSQILNVTNDTSSTNVIYSKVYFPASGCFSKDTLLLQVNSLPEFPSSVVTGFACAPGSIDVSTLINPFSTAPLGTDTLYYDDATFTTLHPNPTNITTTDTVYMVFATNTNPVCSDTAVAYVDILQAGNLISAQTGTFPVYYSNAGNYGCAPRTFVDGMSDTIRSSADCRRVAAVTDLPNSTSLGLVNACQEIAASTPYHNGQPYVNRAYQITAATSDTAVVCLYYLDQDFQDYNADALFAGWPTLPSNICISKVNNGDLNTPGHTAVTIPNALISTSYDPISTVWTVCFPVSGFSYFYCHACNPVNAPLPIDLTLFTGRQVNNQSLLSWTTASEQNNSHFIVERSKDGTTFNSISSAIATKANGGNSSTALNYSFTDELPLLGHNYYRLQQHDIDGKVSTSQIVDIYYGNDTKVTLFPNPVRQIMNVDINTPKATSATLKVTDATGRVVKVISMQLSAGANSTQVDLQGLADGMYMVHITNGKGLDYAQPIRKN
jgi:hypothetical protein